MSARKSLIRSSVAGTALVAFGIVPALAADIIYQEPAPAPAPIVHLPVSDWTGGYVGAQVGYGFSGRTTVLDAPRNRISTDGFLGGVFGGYNFQHGQVVYGIEADANYSDVDGNNAGETARTRYDGSVRGRLGYAVTDDVLVYGTAGVAIDRHRVTGIAGDRTTKALVGYTVGAGVDAKLTENVFGRVEYRYSDYGDKYFNSVGSDVEARNNRVTVGLGYKF